jgi:hypothetical protein
LMRGAFLAPSGKTSQPFSAFSMLSEVTFTDDDDDEPDEFDDRAIAQHVECGAMLARLAEIDPELLSRVRDFRGSKLDWAVADAFDDGRWAASTAAENVICGAER